MTRKSSNRQTPRQTTISASRHATLGNQSPSTLGRRCSSAGSTCGTRWTSWRNGIAYIKEPNNVDKYIQGASSAARPASNSGTSITSTDPLEGGGGSERRPSGPSHSNTWAWSPPRTSRQSPRRTLEPQAQVAANVTAIEAGETTKASRCAQVTHGRTSGTSTSQ